MQNELGSLFHVTMLIIRLTCSQLVITSSVLCIGCPDRGVLMRYRHAG